MAQDDQKHGPLLTDRQRRHLQEETDIEPGSAADRSERSRIRKRVKNAIMDFRFLFEHLHEDDRDKILEGEAFERAELHDGMVSAMALFYEMSEREGWPFDELLERALEDAYRDNYRTPPRRMIVEDVDLEVSLGQPRSREQIERAALLKFKRGEALTDREYRILTEPEGWIIDPETDLYLDRQEILQTLRERRRERAREQQLDEMVERSEDDEEMFGSLRPVPSDLQDEFQNKDVQN